MTTNSFNKFLDNYADLIIKHGLNVQPGQPVNIIAEAYHRDFVLLIAEKAYQAGSSFVNIDLVEPRLVKTRIQSSKSEHLEYVPKWFSQKFSEFVDTTSANVRIVGLEYPELLADLDPKKVNAVRKSQYMAMQHYYREGIEKSKVHWCLAAAATSAWAKRLFPELDAAAAKDRLWNEIFKICRVDQDNYLEIWRNHNSLLHQRSAWLNSLQIKTLHFRGPGTDLKVGLSEAAIFKGGGDLSPLKVEFEPNIPTEECFTTPDYRETEGTVRATRPFLVNGKLIKGLKMRFEKGILVDFEAEDGAETFKEYIDSDPGGRRLGEVALVGIDSPVYQSGIIFEEILYDENAACHIAVGLSYKFCLKNGDRMSAEELEAIGANQSTVHTDMMISSEEVDVTVVTRSGETIDIIRKGSWISK